MIALAGSNNKDTAWKSRSIQLDLRKSYDVRCDSRANVCIFLLTKILSIRHLCHLHRSRPQLTRLCPTVPHRSSGVSKATPSPVRDRPVCFLLQLLDAPQAVAEVMATELEGVGTTWWTCFLVRNSLAGIGQGNGTLSGGGS